VVSHHQYRQLRELADDDPALAELFRLLRHHLRRRRVRRDGLEVLLGHGHDLVEGDTRSHIVAFDGEYPI